MNIITKIKVLFFKSCFFCLSLLRKIGIKIKMTDMEKEYIIAKCLETDEGRAALAKAMVEPIRKSFGYQAAGRKILMVDEYVDI